MIKSGDLIKHKDSLDVAIQVTYSTVDPETSNFLVKGIWINQGQVQSYPITTNQYKAGVPAEFFIKPEHLENWLRCIRPDSSHVRNEEWKPLVCLTLAVKKKLK